MVVSLHMFTYLIIFTFHSSPSKCERVFLQLLQTFVLIFYKFFVRLLAKTDTSRSMKVGVDIRPKLLWRIGCFENYSYGATVLLPKKCFIDPFVTILCVIFQSIL